MKRWLLLALMFVSLEAAATSVRGRVDFFMPYGVVPMAGATVSLCLVGSGCLQYMTGQDGMYYFNAAPGDHILLVNGVQRHRIFIPNQLSFDIPPLRGN